MTNARIEEVPADRTTAREYLAQGRSFLHDARTPLSNESRQVLLQQAAICTCDAILVCRATRELYLRAEDLLRR